MPMGRSALSTTVRRSLDTSWMRKPIRKGCSSFATVQRLLLLILRESYQTLLYKIEHIVRRVTETWRAAAGAVQHRRVQGCLRCCSAVHTAETSASTVHSLIV